MNKKDNMLSDKALCVMQVIDCFSSCSAYKQEARMVKGAKTNHTREVCLPLEKRSGSRIRQALWMKCDRAGFG